jgi:peptidoglycan/LPS O-acetylase OafA/YrhL
MGLLRILLALSVLAVHGLEIYKSILLPADTAVLVFYIISGFYIAMILNEKYIEKNNSYKLFITNRFLRIYPIHWFILFATVFVNIVKGIFLPYQTWRIIGFLSLLEHPFTLIYFVFSNIFIFGQSLTGFISITTNKTLVIIEFFRAAKISQYYFVGQAWTVGVELSFYLIAPFIFKLSKKIILVFAIVSFLLNIYLYNISNGNLAMKNVFLPSDLVFFLLGYFSYHYYLKIKSVKNNLLINSLNISLIIFTILYSFLPDFKFTHMTFTCKQIFYFLFVAITIPFLFNTYKSNKWDREIGELSYPIYMSHMFVKMCCKSIPLKFYLFKNQIFEVLLVILFSYLLNKIISIPLEKFRQSRIKLA